MDGKRNRLRGVARRIDSPQVVHCHCKVRGRSCGAYVVLEFVQRNAMEDTRKKSAYSKVYNVPDSGVDACSSEECQKQSWLIIITWPYSSDTSLPPFPATPWPSPAAVVPFHPSKYPPGRAPRLRQRLEYQKCIVGTKTSVIGLIE